MNKSLKRIAQQEYILRHFITGKILTACPAAHGNIMPEITDITLEQN